MPKKSKRKFTLERTLRSTRTARAARTAQKAIRQLREQPIGSGPVAAPAYPEWAYRYQQMICDYLLESLTEREFLGWSDAYTALWELTGSAWAARSEDAPDLGEHEAWSRVRISDRLRQHAIFTLLSPNFSPRLFCPHYAGFLRFAAKRNALSPATCERLVSEFESLTQENPALVA